MMMRSPCSLGSKLTDASTVTSVPLARSTGNSRLVPGVAWVFAQKASTWSANIARMRVGANRSIIGAPITCSARYPRQDSAAALNSVTRPVRSMATKPSSEVLSTCCR
jgi:hypothetical protein